MAHIDLYLRRERQRCNLSALEDIYDLYSFIPNEDLRSLLAIYHSQLNHWFSVINEDISKSYDENGNELYQGGYFHAQDSRDLLEIFDAIDRLRTNCNSTPYAFRLTDTSYDDAIRRCRRFVVKSGGSTIPENFPPIEIIELTPIFQMSASVALSNDEKEIYANLKPVGEGSYARVFSYVDPNYQIPIILKRARTELDAKEIQRFKQEYEVLRSLHSPYIVEVYAYNEAKNEYTMEYMDESIYDFIQKQNCKLSLSSRKAIISQICRGLSYIHSKGLLHRDISPTNVFVKHYNDIDVVKIGDFGLVKIPNSNLTSIQSELKGSLNDPDLIHVGFSNYEMCHETYALTRLCYFILTGRTNINKQKDGAIKQFWDKGTNLDRTKRFRSTDDLLSAVRAITEDNC